MVIFHKDKYLIFITIIPLVYNNGFDVYNIIPLPIKYGNQSLVLIEPEIEVLAFSHDKQTFLSLTYRQWEMCQEIKSYTLCKNSQPIHHRAKVYLCEIALLLNQQNLPNNCKIKFVSANSCVWHRLSLSNSWLFYKQTEITMNGK